MHIFQRDDFGGDFTALREESVFAQAVVIADTLSWDLGYGLIYDVAPDGLWLHAHGHCDGSHDLDREVER